MHKDEFINRILKASYRNRFSSWQYCDCFGLVMMYYKHVLGVELPVLTSYNDNTPMAKCWDNEIATGNWVELERPTTDGIVFTSYQDEQPAHVGITISRTKVLHIFKDAQVQINSIAAVRKRYGILTYHAYNEHSVCQNL